MKWIKNLKNKFENYFIQKGLEEGLIIKTISEKEAENYKRYNKLIHDYIIENILDKENFLKSYENVFYHIKRPKINVLQPRAFDDYIIYKHDVLNLNNMYIDLNEFNIEDKSYIIDKLNQFDATTIYHETIYNNIFAVIYANYKILDISNNYILIRLYIHDIDKYKVI